MSIAPTTASVAPPAPINRLRIDRITITVVGGFGFVFGLQTLPSIIDQLPYFEPVLIGIVLVLIYGGLLAVVVTSLLHRFTRVSAGFVAVVLLLTLVYWPALSVDPAVVVSAIPWIWYLVTIGTAFVAYASSVQVTVAYAAVTPVLYGIVRVLPSGGGVSLQRALLDSFYVAIVGGVMVTIIVVLRQAADRVDRAQLTAMAEYESAVRHHANEVERVEVDAFVHDSVLASFLAAASADTPAQRSLAAGMAATALENLLADDAAIVDGAVSVALLERQVQHAADALGAKASVRRVDGMLPRVVAEAVVGATWQALTNSAQHAGPATSVSRAVTATLGPESLEVVVSDDGSGFELDVVPPDRLGIRLSVIERIGNVGGRAAVVTRPGAGTRVELHWSRSDAERSGGHALPVRGRAGSRREPRR